MIAFWIHFFVILSVAFGLYMFGCTIPIGKERNKMFYMALVALALVFHLALGLVYGEDDRRDTMNKDLIEKGLKHYVTDSKTGETKLIWTNPEFNIEKNKGE
jgi:hypothetical protein